MIDAIKAGRGRFDVTSLNYDNYGPIETVYRVAILEPVERQNPDGPWSAYCSGGPSACPPNPRYAVFLGLDDQQRMPMTDYTIMEDTVLFRYGNETYAVSGEYTGVNIFRMARVSSDGEVFRQPTCIVLTRP